VAASPRTVPDVAAKARSTWTALARIVAAKEMTATITQSHWYRPPTAPTTPEGPFTLDELAARIAKGALPRGGMVAIADGPTPPAPGAHWQPAEALLRAPGPVAGAGTAPAANDYRTQLAATSAYTDLRLFLGVVNWLAIVGVAVACIATLAAGPDDIAWAIGQAMAWIALLFAWWIARGLATAFLDFVDHSLQQRRD
jgi:hypothetical protein